MSLDRPGQAAARARGAALRAPRRQQVDPRRLPPHLGHQPAARQFVRESRFREDLYYRVNAFSIRLPSLQRAAGGHPGAGRSVSSPATAPPTACRSTPSGSRARRTTCCSAITGPATSANSKAPCRAPRCRRLATSSAARTSSSCTRRWPPARPRRRRRLPTLRGRRTRAHRARARSGAAGTSWRRRACSTSAAAPFTARSTNTVWSPASRRRRGAGRALDRRAAAQTRHARPPKRGPGLHRQRHRHRRGAAGLDRAEHADPA